MASFENAGSHKRQKCIFELDSIAFKNNQRGSDKNDTFKKNSQLQHVLCTYATKITESANEVDFPSIKQ